AIGWIVDLDAGVVARLLVPPSMTSTRSSGPKRAIIAASIAAVPDAVKMATSPVVPTRRRRSFSTSRVNAVDGITGADGCSNGDTLVVTPRWIRRAATALATDNAQKTTQIVQLRDWIKEHVPVHIGRGAACETAAALGVRWLCDISTATVSSSDEPER